MTLADAVVPVAVTDRSGFDESVHHGVVAVVDGDGSVVYSAGDPSVAIYPRSSNKPMQAAAMVDLGVALDDESLALACASHDGTARHLAVVRRTLAGAGLDESALGNTPDLPIEEAAAHAVIAAGGLRTPLQMNCSGKHAAMVATCVHRGWSTHDYLDVDHPLQVAITERIAELAGPVTHIGIDGCGAPAHVVSLAGLARAFGRLAATRGDVWRAMTTQPELVGGDTRTVTRVMRALPDAMAKDGAQGVFAIGFPDGSGAAVKVADGQARPIAVVLASALSHLGVELDGADLSDPMLGHGRPVGVVRSLL